MSSVVVSLMKPASLCVLLLAGALVLEAFAQESKAKPIYANDFSSTAAGKTPEEFMVLSGTFLVKEEGGNKFLELPGSPLDTFGLLFGPTEQAGLTASARFFGTRQGRKFPTF